MKRYWVYFKYIVRHKWYVFLACLEWKVPLHLAIFHDWTKFTAREFKPYAHNFYNADGSKRDIRDKSGAYDPNKQPDEFKLAWLSHQRNKHHWQAWISIGDRGQPTAMPMPEKYVREMVADWTGAGRAISGRKDPWPWYSENMDKMILHYDTAILLNNLRGNKN